MTDPDMTHAPTRCANCLEVHHLLPDVCLIGAIAGVVADGRETITLEEAQAALAEINTVDFWEEYLGPACDAFEDFVLRRRSKEDSDG